MNLSFVSRHPLEEQISGFETRPGSNHLAVLRRPVVFSVLSGDQQAAGAALMTVADADLRVAGPFEWLLVSEKATAESLARALSGLGEGRISFIEQSDGRCVLRLSGPDVRPILAKCVAVDLHRDVFGEGHAANVLCCHVSANLARVGSDTFEIVVMRSMAETVFHEVMEMGREFALTAGFAD